jgi:hypothetical protein
MAMLETREPEVLEFAMSQAHLVDMSKRCEAYLLLDGYEFVETGLRKLYTNSLHHIFFPSEYWPTEHVSLARWREMIRRHHPTWKLADSCAPKMRFGGHSQSYCAGCGGELHHFITLEPIPDTLGLIGLEQLELALVYLARAGNNRGCSISMTEMDCPSKLLLKVLVSRQKFPL